MILWRPTRSSRTNTQKRSPLHYRGLECKSRKSRNTGLTGTFGLVVQHEAGRRLTEFCQENALVIANTLFQQHKRRLYTWTSPDGQHQNQTDYILCSWRWKSSILLVKTRPGVDCGSDHELLIAKFRLKWKKVGKITRPFSNDLNQITYNYTVEVTNRFKRLDMIDRVLKNYGWRFMTLYRRQGSRPSPIKRNVKGKMVVWGGLINSSEKRNDAKGKGEKERYTHLNAEFQRIAQRGKKAFLSDQYKEIEENNRMGKTRDLLKKKTRDPREHFMQRWTNKGQK